MAHSRIIISGVTDDEKHNIQVEYSPEDKLSEDDARKEATEWVKWVKKQYDDYEQDEGGR